MFRGQGCCETWPGRVVVVLYCFQPRWFGWETGRCVVVSHQLWLFFDFVHVQRVRHGRGGLEYLLRRLRCGQRLCVCVGHGLGERNSPNSCLCISPPFENRGSGDLYCRVVKVVDVDFFSVKYGCVATLRKSVCAEQVVPYSGYHVYLLGFSSQLERQMHYFVCRGKLASRVLEYLVGASPCGFERVTSQLVLSAGRRRATVGDGGAYAAVHYAGAQGFPWQPALARGVYCVAQALACGVLLRRLRLAWGRFVARRRPPRDGVFPPFELGGVLMEQGWWYVVWELFFVDGRGRARKFCFQPHKIGSSVACYLVQLLQFDFEFLLASLG